VTAPLSSGISIVPPSAPTPGAGVLARSQWVRLGFTNSSYLFQPARWGASAQPTLRTAQEVVTFVAGEGNVLSRFNYGLSSWQQDAFCLGGELFDKAALGPFSQPKCLVFRELLQFTRNTTATTNVYLGHGFSCQFDTEVPSGNVNIATAAGAIGFLGYAYSPTTGTYFTIKKPRGGNATITALSGFDGALWHRVEHRLYAPSLALPGIYELRLNGELVFRVTGDDAAFPQITAANVRYQAVGAASSNYGGISGGVRVLRSDLFVCDGSPASLEYL
jgi:hypothetical protein